MIGQKKGPCKPEIVTLGIDASLRGTGLCSLELGSLHPYFLPEKKLTGVARLVVLRARLSSYLDTLTRAPDIAVIEGYSYDSINRLSDIAEWGGQVKVELYERDIPLIIATPKQLKKFSTGSGDADKDKVMAAAQKKWGLYVDGIDNLADAAVLAKIGEVYLTGDSEYRSELEVVKKIKAPKARKHEFRKLRGVV